MNLLNLKSQRASTINRLRSHPTALRWLLMCIVVATGACGGDIQGDLKQNLLSATNATSVTSENPGLPSVVSLVKADEHRIDRTTFEYTYRVEVSSGSSSRVGLRLNLTSVGQGTTVIDGSVEIGNMPANRSIVSTDTITIRQDRRVPLILETMKWQSFEYLEGAPLPSEPDPAANNATLAGIDSNSNGIRDDIDRLIAATMGSNPADLQAAIIHARTLQEAIRNPTQENVGLHIRPLVCANIDFVNRVAPITKATLNTVKRRVAYAQAFAGVELSSDVCQSSDRSTVLKKKPLATFSGRAESVLLNGNASEPVKIIYVNGIMNTVEDHWSTKDRIERLLRTSILHQANRRTFDVRGVWNPTGWYGKEDAVLDNLYQDKVELFMLKTAEEHFAADFEKITSPHYAPRDIDKVAAAAVAGFADDLTPGSNSLESTWGEQAMDMALQETRKAIQRLANHLKSGPVIVIAHSQGNLLANLAYAKAASELGSEVNKSIRIVNIANTSRFSVSSLNISHGADAALFADASNSTSFDLESMPFAQGWFRSTPKCTLGICFFTLATPTFRGLASSPTTWESKIDSILVHSMTGTYLSDGTIPGIIDRQGVTFTSAAVTFANRFEDIVYTAANSLLPLIEKATWAGNWAGQIGSSCGSYSGPIRVVIVDLGGGLISETTYDVVGDAYGPYRLKVLGNVAEGIDVPGQKYVLNGTSLTVGYTPACQSGTLQRSE